MTTFKDRLKEAIALKGVTQAEVCEATNIPKSALSSYITGKYEAKQDRVYILAKYFNVSEAWLMGCDVPMEKPQNKPSEPPARDPPDEKILQLFSQLTPEERREVLGLIFEKLHSRGAI